MKKIVSIMAGLVAGLSLVSAQNFTLTCNGEAVTEGSTIEVSGVIDNVDVFSLTANFVLTSTSDEVMTFSASYEALDVEDGAFVQLCAFGTCMSTNTTGDHEIQPGAVHGVDPMDVFDIAYTPAFGSTNPGIVKVVMSDKTAREDLTFTLKFIPQSAGASNESLTAASIVAYPNPASENVNFRLDNVKAGSKVVLRDLSGKTLRTASVSGASEVSMSLQGLSSALYFYSVEENGSTVAVGKLMVR